jgi:myo-inositol 2-dehydrogenase / D-chiro-inositol 1-dehydrogenase
MQSTNKIGVAVIGAGRIGRIHAVNACANANARVLHVHDASRDSQDALADLVGAKPANLEEIFASKSVDAVLICSPTDTHVELITAAAKAGKAVFCEKPVDLDAERVKSCLAIVEAKGVPFMVAFNRRFDPDVVELRRRVLLGEVGDVELVTITSKDPGPPPVDYVKRSGGFFRDMLIHDFDMVRFLMSEEPAQVYAVGGALVSPELKELGEVDTAAVTLQMRSGRIATVTSSRRATYGYDQRIEVHGSKGQLAMTNLPLNRVMAADAAGFRTAPALHSFMERYAVAYKVEMDAFIRALVGGTAPSPTGRDGLKAQLLADAATESFNSGRPVKL